MKLLKNLPLKEREFETEDFNFILNSWLVSFRNSMEFKKVSNKDYYATQPKILINIIQNPDTKIKIYCNKEYPTQIFCYMVYNEKEKIIHFVYTKYNFRRLGACRSIIESVYPNEIWGEVQATFFKSFSPFSYNPLKRY